MASSLIEITDFEPSPFEQEPELCGIYHWHEGCRSMHMHEDRVELNFIYGGNGTHIVGGEICDTQPGDLLVHNSYVLHDESMMLEEQMNAWCIAVKNIKLPGMEVNKLLPAGMHPRIPCQVAADILGSLYPMVHHYVLQPGGYQTANSLARAIVLIAYQMIQTNASPSNRKENELVRAMESYIDEHYFEPITLAELAGELHASEYYLSHLFRDITGYSLQQYILRRRVGKAQCMLIYTNDSLTEIAGRVGFEDSNYFSRAFKKLIGMPPKLYRQKWKAASRGSTPSDIHI